MKSRNNLAIVLLLTILTVVAFAFPASAESWVTGQVRDQATDVPLENANVTATNITGSTTIVYSDLTDQFGNYRISIPSTGFGRIYTLDVSKNEYNGQAGLSFFVNNIDLQTYGPFDILMVKDHIPDSKVDTLSLPSIPADRGISSLVVTATIRDQDGNLLDFGTVNSSRTAFVSFYLRNGSLDVTTGRNGSLSNTGGGVLDGTRRMVRGVPLDINGNASVTLISGNSAGTVDIFNNVTVNDRNGNEVNATITVVFTPLVGHVAGTVRSSESARIENATVSAYRLLWTFNGSAPAATQWTKTWELVKSTVTDSFGDYVLPFIDLKYDVIGNTDIPSKFYEYNESTNSKPNTDVPPPLANPPTSGTQLLTNIIKVTAEKFPYNNGYAEDFLSVDETETMDVVITSGQPNELLVQIDGTPHQLESSGTQNSRHTVTGKLLKDGIPFAILNEDVKFTIPDTTLVQFVVNGVVVNDLSVTVKTDVDGVATVPIQTSSENVGIVRITGTHTTRDNVGLTDWDLLNVQSSGEVSGTVSNENNVNLIGASVRLTQYNTSSKKYDIYPVKDILGNDLTDKISNNIGFYTFTYVPTGQYKVEGTYNGVVGFAAPVNVTQGTKTANIVVVGALGALNGTVTSNGIVLQGVDIFLGSNIVKSATTGVNGTYNIIDIVPGNISVKASKSGYYDATVTATIVSGETTTANFVLTPIGVPTPTPTPSGEISGTVSNENNVNLIGASVRLLQFNTSSQGYDIYPVKDTLGNDLTDKISNSIGFYTFTYVPAGQYMVEATYNGVVGFAAPVNVTLGTKTANIVVVGALGALSGTVTSNGTALQGVEIFIGSNTVKSATTDVNGSYNIIDIVPGNIVVKAEKTGYIDATVNVTIVSGETATANIQMVLGGTSLVDSYLPPGGTSAEWKAGLLQAMDDYFENGTLTKDELISVMDAYFA